MFYPNRDTYNMIIRLREKEKLKQKLNQKHVKNMLEKYDLNEIELSLLKSAYNVQNIGKIKRVQNRQKEYVKVDRINCIIIETYCLKIKR